MSLYIMNKIQSLFYSPNVSYKMSANSTISVDETWFKYISFKQIMGDTFAISIRVRSFSIKKFNLMYFMDVF